MSPHPHVLSSPSAPYHVFFFNDTATTEIYTLSLHDALPIMIRRPPRSTLFPTRRSSDLGGRRIFNPLRFLPPNTFKPYPSGNRWFQALLTPLPGYFSTFPHGTSILSVLVNI